MIFAEVCLITNDVQRLSSFYKTVLQTTSDCDDMMYQEIIIEGAALTILKNDAIHSRGNKNIFLAFTVNDVDKEYERLKNLGVEIIEPPTTRFWGARNMIFSDPDGNNVVFRSLLND